MRTTPDEQSRGHEFNGACLLPPLSHDACGVGAAVHLDGSQSRDLLEHGLAALGRMGHRGGALGHELSDGAGVLFDAPWQLLQQRASRWSMELNPSAAQTDQTDSGRRPTASEWLALNPRFVWRDPSQASVPILLFFFLDADSELAVRQIGWLIDCISKLTCRCSAQGTESRARDCDDQLSVDQVVNGASSVGFVRLVPLSRDKLPTQSRASAPTPVQMAVTLPESLSEAAFCSCLRLQLISAKASAGLGAAHKPQTIDLVSASSRTVVYKALCQGRELASVYPDLQDSGCVASFCLFHERFATNTEPQWHLIQPFENLAHNGEINTIRGQAFRQCEEWAKATGQSQQKMAHQPLSDSYLLSLHLHGLTAAGLDLDLAIRAAVGVAHTDESTATRSFAQALKSFSVPWDGPAALLFTDGKRVGAALDRNGLRPLRYFITGGDRLDGGCLYLCSEAGAFEQTIPDGLSASGLCERGRLGPGEMLVVDLSRKQIWFPDEVRQMHMDSVKDATPAGHESSKMLEIQKSVWTAPQSHAETRLEPPPLQLEFLREYLLPTAKNGSEPTSSMGFDTSLAPLSPFPVPFSHYFRIRFAQVTNPPIDSIRESLALDLSSTLTPMSAGPALCHAPRHHLSAEAAPLGHAQGTQTLVLKSPIVSRADRDHICSLLGEPLRIKAWLPLSVRDTATQVQWLNDRVAEVLLNDGETVSGPVPRWRWILIEDEGCPADAYPVPSLVVCAVVRQAVRRLSTTDARSPLPMFPDRLDTIAPAHIGNRPLALPPIGISCADILTSHDASCALSLGADFVHPWVGEAWVSRHQLRPSRYLKALEMGLKKNMGRMGVSVFDSYKTSMNIDAFGLSRSFCEQFLNGMPGRYGHIGLGEVLREARERHLLDKNGDDRPELLGIQTESWKHAPAFWKWRAQGLYRHLNTPDLLIHLRKAILLNSEIDYLLYADTVHKNGKQAGLLRGFLDVVAAGTALPIDSIESVDSIYSRFSIGAMSVGSISAEAHETLAIGANRIGVRSNSGEGGEDPQRYEWGRGQAQRRSRIKQVASGRFGVTLDYLLSADEIQIKVAQGAKPGEGGQLPGSKVNAYIAGLRHTEVGVSLISPPPHHDIYSIEDLKQLIHDLKSANPRAQISVKLTSASGVGRIAVGVAKAGADLIGISGHDGGTGAAPALSIAHVGEPWEIGVVEAHQNLTKAGLRQHVRLWVDGQLRSGRDIVVATLLGADEFSFSTGALISLGCVLMRKCHDNACPAGIATQDAALRAKFAGQPEAVSRYFRFIAEDARQWLSKIGFRSLSEIRGRKDLLQFVRPTATDHWKLRLLDVRTFLFAQMPEGSKAPVGQRLLTEPGQSEKQIINDFAARYCPVPGSGFRSLRDTGMGTQFQTQLLKSDGNHHQLLQESWAVALQNTDLSFGTRLGSEYRRLQLEDGARLPSLVIQAKGFAGQSLGAFLPAGISIHLTGAANDGVGKGLCGGHLSVSSPESQQPNQGARAHSGRGKKKALQPALSESVLSEPVLCGNSCLYGATSGQLFVAGRAGERFAVRNSGALAVVEGTGDHACEYMTGGLVVILGLHGRNLGAGMTGGKACIIPWRADGSISRTDLDQLADRQSRDVQRSGILSRSDQSEIEELLKAHVLATQSVVGRAVLANICSALKMAWMIVPADGCKAVAAPEAPGLTGRAGRNRAREQISRKLHSETIAHVEGT